MCRLEKTIVGESLLDFPFVDCGTGKFGKGD